MVKIAKKGRSKRREWSKDPRRGGQRGENGSKSKVGAVKEARVGSKPSGRGVVKVVKRAKKRRSARREWSKEPRRGGQRGESGSKSQVGAVREANVVKRVMKGRSER